MKISELTQTFIVDGTEVLPIVQDGTTKKVTIADALSGGGVGELNGLTGNIDIVSNDNSVTINASGTEIDLSVSGGGGVNPTDTFMPVNSNGTFSDAPLQTYDGTTIQTVFGGGLLYFGWSIDLNLDTVVIGDYNDSYDGTKLVIGENTGLIFTRTQSLQSGYNLNFNTETYIFGDWENNDGVVLANSSYLFGKSSNNYGVNLDFGNGIFSFGEYASGHGVVLDFNNDIFNFKNSSNKISIAVENSNQHIYTSINANDSDNYQGFDISTNALVFKFGDGTNQYELYINSDTKQITLGDWNGQNNVTYIEVNDGSQIITLNSYASGLYANGASLTTYIGDWDGQNNSTFIGINDNNQKILFSSNLLVGTSGSSSGNHLKVNVGGTDYVIELKNP